MCVSVCECMCESVSFTGSHAGFDYANNKHNVLKCELCVYSLQIVPLYILL